ncbi:MAG: hypothetical protein KJ066_06640 [Acidobacteria bacterium]|nr:hypothetical protein [Acidobacteriota bacterium]
MNTRRPRQAGRRWPGAPAIAAVLLLAGIVTWVATDGGAWRPWTPGPSADVAGTADGSADVLEPSPESAGRAATVPGVGPTDAGPRDLAADEARGGHTLARHVGLSDADLVARLGREAGISAASSFADRATAERVVAAALAENAARIDAWHRGEARRANLVVRHRGSPDVVIGRVLRRGARTARPGHGARVVLRWDEGRGDFYVLTAYPDD